MGRFKKGLVLGGLLGAGLVWLNATKKGKQVRDQVIDYAAEIFADVKKRILESETWDTMSKSKYARIIEDAVNAYSKRKGLAENVSNMIKKLLAAQWKNLEKELKKKK